MTPDLPWERYSALSCLCLPSPLLMAYFVVKQSYSTDENENNGVGHYLGTLELGFRKQRKSWSLLFGSLLIENVKFAKKFFDEPVKEASVEVCMYFIILAQGAGRLYQNKKYLADEWPDLSHQGTLMEIVYAAGTFLSRLRSRTSPSLCLFVILTTVTLPTWIFLVLVARKTGHITSTALSIMNNLARHTTWCSWKAPAYPSGLCILSGIDS